jgi:2-polyprenyl-3-methyl-5-hydroxy-6-metoxy-1,4-benzoquinol methylase
MRLIVFRGYKSIEWNDEKIKRYWDYVSLFPENYFSYQVGKALVDRLSVFFPNAKNVLDYGCGPGFLIPHLMDKNMEVSALDFSGESLAVINKKFRGKRFFKSAITIDQLKDVTEKFDVIMAVEVIEHLDDKYLEQTARNIKRLVSDNGIVIFTTPNDEDLSKSIVYCPECDHVFHRWQHVRTWSKSSLTLFLKSNGFDIVAIFETNFLEPKMLTRLKLVLDRVLGRPAAAQRQPHLVAVAKNSEKEQREFTLD